MRRRTSDSGDLFSRNWRVMRRSSSCSSEKAKFMGPLVDRVGGCLGGVLATSPGRFNRRCVHARTLRVVEQVGARELRQNLAAVLRQAAAGERIVVTVDGKPVAQLGP